MGLQVWLPLTKDLSNQGLADVVITNNGATPNTAGKLGGCYYFTPSQWIKISVPEHMTTIKNTTIAAWVKSHSTTLALGGISHDGNSSLAGVSLYTSGWQLSGSGSSYKYIASGITANSQEWHHVACTIANDEITIYADGAKIFSTTLTVQGIISTDITSDHFIEIGCDHPGGNEYLTGYVNDFRIYDHCLSTKEIKELAKGLVLHYKLDDLTEEYGNTVFDNSGYKNDGALISAPTLSTDSARYSNSISFDGTDDGILIQNFQLSNIINSEVTYSFWIKPDGEAGKRSVYFGSYSGISWSIEKTTGNLLRLYWNGSPDETTTGITIVDNIWQYICITKKGTNDVKVYINGEQKWTSTAAHNALTFPTTYRIGRDTRSGDNTPYKGLISDFRIYATALSAEDIAELYHTAASIDKQGNLFCGEVVE